MHTRPSMIIFAASLAIATASCSSSSSDVASEGGAASCDTNPANYHPQIVPADFSTTIDNKYLSYPPGLMLSFVQTDGNVVEQDVMTDTKMVLGVTTVVVHDFLKTKDGMTLEDTYDYYAQDKVGNVWYFGEDTKAYSGAVVSTTGSWIAGVNCASPGIVMEAHPQVGDTYRQEYRPGEAEDEAAIVGLSEAVTVPYGMFDNCIKTKEFTVLAPGDIENKYYCPQVGLVRSHDIGTIDTGKSEDLVSVDGKTMACGTN